MEKKLEAQCPCCEQWSPVRWMDELPPGGYWWDGSGCCPKCDKPVAVESECEFRIAIALKYNAGIDKYVLTLHGEEYELTEDRILELYDYTGAEAPKIQQRRADERKARSYADT